MKQYSHDDFDLFDEDDELELALRASTLAARPSPPPRQITAQPELMPRPRRIDYGRALVRTMLSVNSTLQTIAERLDDEPHRHHARDDDDCAPRRPMRDERCDPCPPARQRPRPRAIECAPRQAPACDGEAVFLGIDSRLVGSAIKPGESKPFTVSTTGPLQITDFYVSDRESADFVISDIKIGRHSRLEGGRLPASMFSSDASQRVPMQAYLPASGEVRIEVTNVAEEPRHFSAGFTGYEV